MAPYAYNGQQWIGYEDEKSVVTKTQYIQQMNLGGAMIWSIDTDDFNGYCTGKKFAIIATIAETLWGEIPTPDPTWTPPTKETTT